MKEIDFLPEWYKSGRQRQISYCRQYIALGILLMVLLVLHFVVTQSISKATAKVAAETPIALAAETKLARFAEIRNQVKELQEKARVIDELDSKIRVGNVLAEISYLIDERIVLSSVEFVAERFGEGRQKRRAGSAISVDRTRSVGKGPAVRGDVRFKVIVKGVAAAASDVAVLVCKLEESPYFCQVVPSFSRNKKIKAGTNVVGGAANVSKVSPPRRGEGLDVSEFEISGYLANYSMGGESNAESSTINSQQ